MNEASGGTPYGTISVTTGALALLGEGCCCVPIISLIAMVAVPLLTLVCVVTGILGVMQGGPDRPKAIAGLALGAVNGVILAGYALMVVAYGGLAVLGNM